MSGALGTVGSLAGGAGVTALTGSPVIGAAAAGAGLTSGGGGGSTGGYDSVLSLIDGMNNILNASQTNAISASQAGTQSAINAQNTGLNSAVGALQSGNSSANTALNNLSVTGAQSANALTQPFSTAGYNALDMYEDSLGVARPAAGNAALASSLYNNAQATNTLTPLFNTLQTDASKVNGASNTLNPNNLFSIGSEVAAPTRGAAPTLGTPTQAQIQAIYNQNAPGFNSATNPFAGTAYAADYSKMTPAQQMQLAQGTASYDDQQAYNAAMKTYNAATPAYNTATNNYNAYNTAYNAYNTALQNPNYQNLALGQAYNSGNVTTANNVNVGPGGVVPGVK